MTKTKKHMQSGVIPFRISDGDLEILLVSTSSQNGWTIPKGNIENGYSASQSAEKEAFEEAGIQGEIIKPRIGEYTYTKYNRTYQVKVFLMAVTLQLADWPEKRLRTRKWYPIKKAGKKTGKEQLCRLIEQLDKSTFTQSG